MWNCSPTQQILSHSFYDYECPVMVDGSKVFNPLYATLSTRKFVRFIKVSFQNQDLSPSKLNKIKEIVNTNHIAIDPEKTYHGGAIILTGNNFTKFIDFEKNRYNGY
jgi:hypothetical protein